MGIRTFFGVFKRAAVDFFNDDAMTLAAAVAFYAALSLAPLLLILVWTAGVLGPETQQAVVSEVVEQTGEEAGGAVRTVLAHAQEPRARTLAGIVSLATVLFSATGVFAQLQWSLNRIWDVPAKSGVRGWVRKRLLSLAALIVIGALLLASVGVTAVLAGMFGSWVPVQIAVGFVVYAVLFGLIFRYLPDIDIAWRDVWAGAVVTAALFAGGNLLIGTYLGRSSVTSSYGAAGSLIALLLWVYYSTLIFFYGAELTQAWAHARGRGIAADQPSKPESEAPGRRGEQDRRNDQRGQPGPAPA